MRFFAEPVLALAALLLVAGGIVMQFFTILSGAVNSAPVNQFYFLQAGTSGIPNARNPSRWTFFAICGSDPASGHNANCGAVVPALPFDPPRNFGTTENVPEQFVGTHVYFYLSRFMFVFYLIALFFAACALFTGLLAICSRLGGYLSGLTVSIALFFQALSASLLTAWVVKGRNAFRSAGLEASVGRYLLAFAWASFACFLIATVLFCLGGALGGDRTLAVSRRRSTKSSKSRASFMDTDSQRRVKDDFSA
ncbi:cortical patch protein [Didymella exigua CBS 183.55]|uniref:Cortical patch protein n=1 Tax=Didymella exigua CBS 183.55 TaxID=1150837 RepID=A0A6A5S767_9PLEO|nr:cortical patch protein [Didymella exigua CBS 183.55]KAF1934346.1 cortical patch protein [Didymella exigua CBS 183.55]